MNTDSPISQLQQTGAMILDPFLLWTTIWPKYFLKIRARKCAEFLYKVKKKKPKILALIWPYWLFPYNLIFSVAYINSNTAIINLGTVNTLTCKPWLLKSMVLFWVGTICCPWKPILKLFFQYRFSSLNVLSPECNAPIDSGSKSREGIFAQKVFCLFICLFVHINIIECLQFHLKDKKRSSAPHTKC